MRIEPMIVFGDEEREVFSRLNPYRSALGDEPDDKSRLGRLLSRVIRGAPTQVGGSRDAETEPVSFEFLGTLQVALREIHERFETESDPAWWRAQGAPGADDAVEGLAAGRARALDDVREAERIVDEARLLVFSDVVVLADAEGSR